jgi:heat shock protein HslJ
MEVAMRPKFTLVWILILAFILSACGGEVIPAENANDVGNPEGAANLEAEPEAPGRPPGEPMIMIVAPELVDCEGAHPQKCMRVKFDPDEDWQYFYDQVEGFEFEPGYRYTLLVEKLEVQDPPADGSAIQYVLVEVQEKAEELVSGSAKLEDHFWVLSGLGTAAEPQGVLETVQISLEYDPATGGISGSAGCNRYFGEATVDGDALTFSTGPLGMTRMACSEEVMVQEAEFIETLGQVTRFAIEGETLYLFTEAEEVLVFSPGTPSR